MDGNWSRAHSSPQGIFKSEATLNREEVEEEEEAEVEKDL